MDAEPDAAVGDGRVPGVEDVRDAHPHRGPGVQPAQGVQTLLARAQETALSLHLQRVPRHIPLHQERVRHGLQEEEVISLSMLRLPIQYYLEFLRNIIKLLSLSAMQTHVAKLVRYLVYNYCSRGFKDVEPPQGV